ncbi:hypothetical protein TrST_g3850 [Triparma strigata]|uniref:Uncharacterized protein n=1 Tax=Triparma strigata TaxID=1606541 RepID=A0A9W6ZMY0_9STRA|nr:hypothetical protein TrST_g3850 [Triparma strigata]
MEISTAFLLGLALSTSVAAWLLWGPSPLLVTPRVGYYGAKVDSYGPPIRQPTVWICFVGSFELTPTTAAACKDGYSPAGSKPPSTALLFTNIGGGEGSGVEQSITPAGLSSVVSMAPFLKANGFSGVTFDMETLSGFASYNDFSQAMKYAVGNCTAAGLLTLLTTAQSGISTGALLTGGDLSVNNSLTHGVARRDDHCYSSNATEVGSVHDICHPYSGISYAGFSGSRKFWPTVGGKWAQSLYGADPVATLNTGSKQNFGPGIRVTGYIVFNKL